MKNLSNIQIKKAAQSIAMSFLFVIGITLSGAVMVPIAVLAQTPAQPTNYVLLAPLPYVSNSNQACADGTTTNADGSCQTNFVTYLLGIFKLVIAMSAILAVVMITYGGLEYIMSASFGAKQDGKERITNAIIGLLLALASYLILYTINPNLVSLKFNVPTCADGSTTCATTTNSNGSGSNAIDSTNNTINSIGNNTNLNPTSSNSNNAIDNSFSNPSNSIGVNTSLISTQPPSSNTSLTPCTNLTGCGQ